MFKDLFKRKKPAFDCGHALAQLAHICGKCTAYYVVFSSIYYDMASGRCAVRFVCTLKEYADEKNYFLSVRREEKFFGDNLEKLLEYAMQYADSPCAFVNPPSDIPEGIGYKVKTFNRTPNNNLINQRI